MLLPLHELNFLLLPLAVVDENVLGPLRPLEVTRVGQRVESSLVDLISELLRSGLPQGHLSCLSSLDASLVELLPVVGSLGNRWSR